MKLVAMGDAAVLVTLAEKVDAEVVASGLALSAALEKDPISGFIECVPTNASVTVHYDPVRLAAKEGTTPFERMAQWIDETAAGAGQKSRPAAGRKVTIPVCYGGGEGPDLEELAATHGLAAADVVALHSGADYYVSAVGFTPGFPYLAGLPAELHTPRRQTPRTRVPSGSVAIGGAQTGVYPQPTPGGWHLIGRTPLRLFNPQARPPALLQVGDRVKFRRITSEEFRTAMTS